MGVIHAVRAACFGGQAGSLGLPPQQRFYFKSGERYRLSCLFFQLWCSDGWNSWFLPQAIFPSHEGFLEPCRLHTLALQ